MALRRMLFNGPPLSGKTTGCLTLPPPRHFLIVPGEMGASSLPADDPDTSVYVWPDLEPRLALQAFNNTADEILAGKHGEVSSLIVDGGHKYAELAMKALGWTTETLDSKEGAREYPKYYDVIMRFFNRMAGSSVRFFAMTCYDGREQAEDATGDKVKGQTATWPEMPGKLAKLIMGAFPCVFHTERTPGNPLDQYWWRLRPIGQLQAAGLHIPARILAKLPARIEVKVNLTTGAVEGGWQTLEQLIAATQKEGGK